MRYKSIKIYFAILLLISIYFLNIRDLDLPEPKNIKHIHVDSERRIVCFSTSRKYYVLGQKTKFNLLSERSISGSQPPSLGTWIINQTTVVINESLLLNGSIVITENGSLIVQNSALVFNMSSDGEYNITVMSNGSLYINATNISSMNNYRYAIFVYRNTSFEVHESIIEAIGFNDTYPGIVVYCDDAKIQNTNISSDYIGILVNGSSNITIDNCYIDADDTNIKIINCTKISINNSLIDILGTGIDIRNSTHIVIANTNVSGGVYCMYIEDSKYIVLDNLSIDQRFKASTEIWGIFINNSQCIEIDSVYIYMDDYSINKATHHGIYLLDSTNITIINSSWNCSIYPSGSGTGWPPHVLTSRIYQIYLNNASMVKISNDKFRIKLKEKLISLTLYYLHVYGIYIYRTRNVILEKNMYLSNMSLVEEIHASGITSGTITYHWWNYIKDSLNINITDNNYYTNQQITTGTYIFKSTNVSLENNTYTSGDVAIYINLSNNTRVENCSIEDHSLGTKIYSSYNISVRVFIANSYEGIYATNTNSSILGGVISASYRSLYMKNTINITLNCLEIYSGMIYLEGATTYNTTNVNKSNYMGKQIRIYGGPDEIYIAQETYGALLIGYTHGSIIDIVSCYLLVYECDNLTADNITIVNESVIGVWIKKSNNISISDLSFIYCTNASKIESSTFVEIRNIYSLNNASILVQIYNSDNVTLASSYVNNLDYFAYIIESSGVTIANITINNSRYGVYADSSSIKITDSIFISCCYAITIQDVSNALIENNIFLDCFTALRAKCGPIIEAINNTFVYCSVAISLDSGFDMSSIDREKVDADIYYNNITQCSIGIKITSISGKINISNSIFMYNDIDIYYENIYYYAIGGATLRITYNKFLYSNQYAIILECGDASIYGNAFYYENSNVILVEENATAKLYYDYYGNYWSGYYGIDLNNDCIIDEPFYIAGLIDQYPISIDPLIYFDNGLILNIDNNTYMHAGRYVYLLTDIPNAAVFFSINNSYVSIVYEPPYRYYINASYLQDGKYLLNIAINNTAYTFLIYFIIDQSKPSVSISIGNYTWLNATDTIEISSFDNYELDHIDVWIDGHIYIVSYENTILINISDLTIEDGYHNLTIVAMDKAQNAIITKIFFYRDTEKPQIFIETQCVVLSGSIVINLNISDNMNLSYMLMLIDGYKYANYSLYGKQAYMNISVDTYSLDDGNHTFTIVVWDQANNSISAIIIRIIDNTPPTISNVTYPEIISLESEYLVVCFYADDNIGLKAI
ncbi:MAG: right-handed parallel beta-helix repeat-containing protein, partial [Candidatus Njordarchaeota archaeon]